MVFTHIFPKRRALQFTISLICAYLMRRGKGSFLSIYKDNKTTYWSSCEIPLLSYNPLLFSQSKFHSLYTAELLLIYDALKWNIGTQHYSFTFFAVTAESPYYRYCKKLWQHCGTVLYHDLKINFFAYTFITLNRQKVNGLLNIDNLI